MKPSTSFTLGGMLPKEDFVEPVKTVELYNWQTGKQCKISDIPTDVLWKINGVVLEGYPAYCGTVDDKRCFKYDKTEKKWMEVSIS